MSNESTQLTQFQQKAQLRLQEMEVEWRKVLFERFRAICREEMMDVMKALVSSTQAPQELQAKLDEIKQSTQTQQVELLTGISQTNEALANLNQKLDMEQPALEQLSKTQESIAKEITSKQEESTKQIQEDVRRSVHHSRSAVMKAVIITAVICLLLSAGAVAALKLFNGSSLMSEQELQERDRLLKEHTALQAEVKTLRTEKSTLQKEAQEMTTKREALQADMRQAIEAQKLATANLSSLQQQIVTLQQLQTQFHFKLLKGEKGGVFVEVPPNAQPFIFESQTYIQIK